MSKFDSIPEARRVSPEEVIEVGLGRGIPFTSVQAQKIAIAATSMLESAARLRLEIERNDEPAFGFHTQKAPGA